MQGPDGPYSLMVKRQLVTVDRTRLRQEVSGARSQREGLDDTEKEGVTVQCRCVVKTMRCRTLVETVRGWRTCPFTT